MTTAPVLSATRRVVLIDSRPDRRAVMSLLVERCPLLSVVGSAGDLAGAENQIRLELADIALVEIQMPISQGLAVIGALRETFPQLRIVVCSFHDDPATRAAAREQGADAYVTKPPSVADLLELVAGPDRAGDASGSSGALPGDLATADR